MIHLPLTQPTAPVPPNPFRQFCRFFISALALVSAPRDGNGRSPPAIADSATRSRTALSSQCSIGSAPSSANGRSLSSFPAAAFVVGSLSATVISDSAALIADTTSASPSTLSSGAAACAQATQAARTYMHEHVHVTYMHERAHHSSPGCVAVHQPGHIPCQWPAAAPPHSQLLLPTHRRKSPNMWMRMTTQSRRCYSSVFSRSSTYHGTEHEPNTGCLCRY